MPLPILASEPVAGRRRVYFQLVLTDGISPALAEAGGQPQITSDGIAWTNTGIGVLVAIGNGRYYADLTTGAVATAGTRIETRYKSASTAECPGDTAMVVAADPYSSTITATLDPHSIAHLYGDVVVGSDGSWTYFDPGTSTPRLRFDPIAAPGGRSVTLL